MIFAPITKANKENKVILEKILYIYYLLCFWKNTAKAKALFDSGSENNAMMSVYILKLGFQVQYTNIRAQKINNSIFKTFKIVLASFQIKNQLGQIWHFQKTFLLIDTNIKVVLEIFFLIFINTNILFSK